MCHLLVSVHYKEKLLEWNNFHNKEMFMHPYEIFLTPKFSRSTGVNICIIEVRTPCR